MKSARTVVGMSAEEGYKLVKHYVSYFVSVKFYTLRRDFEIEELVNELYVKFLDKGFFAKYDESITSRRYYVMNGVRNSLIDLLRKQKNHSSLDKLGPEGIPLGMKIPAPDVCEETALGRVTRDEIMEMIPNETRSKSLGNSPVIGECKMTPRVVALHLEMGYSPSDIAAMFTNPQSGREVTYGRMHQIIMEMRKSLLVSMGG